MIRRPAYAKINLTLDVVGKRGDGYHLLETVMQAVSLCDWVSAEKADGITPAIRLPRSFSGQPGLTAG